MDLGHRPFVSGVMTAEVISEFLGTKGGGMGGYFLDKEGGSDADNGVQIIEAIWR